MSIMIIEIFIENLKTFLEKKKLDVAFSRQHLAISNFSIPDK